jgi:glycosyltransferase involved in cell wall biosynthesis
METINNQFVEKIDSLLSIAIATYNHSSLLKNTLQALLDSPVKDCHIVVLNNKSTDDTLRVCEYFSNEFSHFEVYTQPVNLGGGSENYIHAIEFCKTEYIWHLADDDKYDFSYFDDVKDILLQKKYDIIQVGAHDEGIWDWGIADTPRRLFEKGYNYFRFSSFLPCNIFRYSFYTRYIKEAYAAISVWYPHMPCLIEAYNNDTLLYVSKHRIVTAVMGEQRYGNYIPIRGFASLSALIKDRKTRNQFMKSQYTNNLAKCLLIWIYRGFIPHNMEGAFVTLSIFRCCNFKERLLTIIGVLPVYLLKILHFNK